MLEVGEIAWVLASYDDLAGDEHTDLRAALLEEVALAVNRMFDLLAFVYEPVAIRRAAAHVAHASRDMRAYARELLEVTLTPEHRRLFLPLLDDVGPHEQLRRIDKIFPQSKLSVAERLGVQVRRPSRCLRSWSRALAIRGARAREVEGLSAMLARVPADDRIIEEVRSLALGFTTASLAKERSAMRLIERILILKRVPMFARTSEELLAEIASNLEFIELSAETSVFAKGDVGDSMYIVVSGCVRVFDGEETLRELGEHEIFGELALLDPAPRSASIVTMEETRLFRLDAETFSQLMAGSVDIVRGVLHVLCERLRRTTKMAVEQA